MRALLGTPPPASHSPFTRPSARLPPAHQFEFRTVVKYACKGRPAVRRYDVRATVDADVRTWGSTVFDVKSYKERPF